MINTQANSDKKVYSSKISRHYFLTSFIIFLILLSIPMSLMALVNDRKQAINLEADNADIDDLKGISVYSGNVILTQGSMVIKSNKLTFYHDKKRKLDRAVAKGIKGKPATFKQRPEGKKVDFRAHANTIVYYLKKNKIHLLKQAYIKQGGDTFRGDKIIYDTKKETVTASGKKKGNTSGKGSRVRVVIQPKVND